MNPRSPVNPMMKTRIWMALSIALMVALYPGEAFSRTSPRAPYRSSRVMRLKRFKHRGVGRCLDPKTRAWIRGCR